MLTSAGYAAENILATMNTLQRNTQPSSRPSLLSFTRHGSLYHRRAWQDPENRPGARPTNRPDCGSENRLDCAKPLHDNSNTVNINKSNINNNNKAWRNKSVPKHHRNYDEHCQNLAGVGPTNFPTRDTARIQAEELYYYTLSRPYEKNQELLSIPADHNYINIKVSSRNDDIIHPDAYDKRKTTLSKRSESSVKKQNSFRRYFGAVGGSSSSFTVSAPCAVPTVSRSMGGVVKRRKHVVLLGLDGSGKTTILMRLKYQCYVDTTPTVGFNHEKVWGGGFRWSAWDVGGGERLRPLWATYARGTDAIVYVVDASAHSDTMEEARLELTRITKLSKTAAAQQGRTAPPLMVLANFQDQVTARCAPEVAKCLSLEQEGLSSGAVACWAVACVCGITGEGLDEALATLRHMLDSAQAARSKAPHSDRRR